MKRKIKSHIKLKLKLIFRIMFAIRQYVAKYINYHTALIAILAIAFLLHLPGLFYSFPLKNTVGDEVTTMGAIFKMMNDQSLRPNYQSFYHLPVTAYAQLPFYAALGLFLKFSGLFADFTELKKFVILDYGYFLPFARLITALFATAAGYLMYKLANRIFVNKKVAILASFLLSFNLMFFQVTHFARAWALQILLLLTAVYVYYVFFTKDKPQAKDYFFISLVTALALGVHLASALIYLVFLILYFYKYNLRDFISFGRGWWSRYRQFIYLQFYLVVWLGFWYYLNPTGFLIYLQQPGIESVNRDWTLWSNIAFYGKVLFNYDALLAVAAMPALILFYKRYPALCLGFVAFILAWVISISYSIHSEPRFIIATIPFLILPVSYFLVWLADRLAKSWQRLLWYLVVIVIIMYLPLVWTKNILKPNTLLLARQWILDNVPSDSVILSGNPYLDLPENKAAALYLKGLSPKKDTVERRFIIAADQIDLPQPRYFVVTAQGFGGIDSFKDILPDFQYAVISFWNNEERAVFRRNAAVLNMNLLQAYYPLPAPADAADIANNMLHPYADLRQVEKTGPFVEIYKVN